MVTLSPINFQLVSMADDVVVFEALDLPCSAFPLFEDIRRRGKLCDVVLTVRKSLYFINNLVSDKWGIGADTIIERLSDHYLPLIVISNLRLLYNFNLYTCR